VEIQYTAIAFRAPEQVRFRHRLLGLSTAWVEAGTLHQASYANLPPGGYTFEVSAVNAHGYASAAPARLAFWIEPIWHERAVVRVAGVLLLAGLVAGVAAWRLGELRRIADLERQAALSRERARLAKDLHDGLGANLTEITLLSGLGDSAQVPAEALAARFDRLTRSTHDALHSLRNVIWVANPKADSLEMLASRLCESAQRTLDAANVRCRLDFPAELPVRAVGPELRRDVLFAVNEAIHNIVRHAQATEVQIALAITERQLALSIRDNGCGFDLNAVRARAEAADRGLGLRSLNERLSPHGGTCEIRSQVGQGTEVTFRVPLPK
jgi:signal transduction histidine kinase